jgi:hypothetical protein
MTTMRSATRTQGRALPALLGAVVASILLGIIGMHALSIGGVMGMDMGTDHSAMTSAADSGPTTGTEAHAGTSSTAPDSGDGHSTGSMMMLCFAMLVAAAGTVLWVFLGLRRKPRIWAHRPAIPHGLNGWVSARLATGPPYAWQFSVIRC